MFELSEIIIVVTLIVSILQIILFFEIWKMTNDTAEIKKTLLIILHSKLTIDQRKEKLIDNVYKIFKEEAVFAERTSIDEIKKWVEESFSLNMKYVQHQFDIYDISEVYSIDQLKRDITDLFLKH